MIVEFCIISQISSFLYCHSCYSFCQLPAHHYKCSFIYYQFIIKENIKRYIVQYVYIFCNTKFMKKERLKIRLLGCEFYLYTNPFSDEFIRRTIAAVDQMQIKRIFAAPQRLRLLFHTYLYAKYMVVCTTICTLETFKSHRGRLIP